MPITQALSAERTVPAVLTIAIHGLFALGLAMSMGVIKAPTPIPNATVIDLPKREPPPVVETSPVINPIDTNVSLPTVSKPVIIVEEWVNPPRSDDVGIAIGEFARTTEVAALPTTAVRLLRQTEPEYPNASRLRGEEGIVYVHITI